MKKVSNGAKPALQHKRNTAPPKSDEGFVVPIDEITGRGKRGRPKKYKTASDLEAAIQKYVNSCWRPKINIYGQLVKDDCGKLVFEQFRPYTVAGLSLTLGMSRETLLQYQKDAEFAPLIDRAKLYVHMFTEEQLISGKNPSGAAFSLKNNFGWKEKLEAENTSSRLITEDEQRLLETVGKLLER